MNVTIELDDQKADLLVAALDLYMRIGIGQFKEVLEFNHRDVHDGVELWKREVDRAPAVDLLNQLSWAVLKTSSNGSHGIFSPLVEDRVKRAAYMHAQIRKQLAEARWKPGDSKIYVQFDEPRPYLDGDKPIVVNVVP